MDFAEARRFMVDGQLRPNRVEDPRIVAALRDLPRERFVPPALAARAYADADVPLPGGRAMLKPLVLARLVQLAALKRGERALVLAAGTGFGAALMAAIGGTVTAVESDPALLAIARAALPAATPAGSVTIVQADPAQGHAAGAPWDVILIEGGVGEVPAAIEEQLAEGGRLVAVGLAGGPPGRALLARRAGGTTTTTAAFDAHAPALPGFAAAPAFAF
ncbi:protein-L-isoaspartate O-methyltransferase family protein [Neoroseomonas oryzicola]|uniref:Protein-L-isoaspartate O-methyltransferase n=1 Tax=Neoroseomonas oryzicola TaxID=535904 RepID=A0A9X9WCF8_9PROT|nr:protein-L-isoaspartate O-methyltransferase [Neoroseomonas oryzicola]MBR0658018.1 protein-L-isoaspartate O-methyltransferase [Neoroseomonas oryzicola]NKE15453.1 protein-L-isoaspartate O-methyltransferase [Neoroseomonas oryzicola]